MAGANSEQLKAIQNTSGALLSAGAGSGKTFVLTEHLVFLAKEWIAEFSESKHGSFEQYIKSKFSKVVLMTFTKKAAGEIGIRITQKFERELEEAKKNADASHPYWLKTFEKLDSLTVSTIHGYCYKLIKQGFFPHVNPNDDIIGEAEFSKQIEEIFSSWLESAVGREDPFYKTIVIIDEVHKMFDGSLSPLEQPDTELLHEGIQNSYNVSKKNSIFFENKNVTI